MAYKKISKDKNKDRGSEKMKTSIQNEIRGRSTRVRGHGAAVSRSWLYHPISVRKPGWVLLLRSMP